MIPKLRIATEMHTAPGWVPIVPDSDTTAAYQADVVLWIAPRPGSQKIAQIVVDALNGAPPIPRPQRGTL